MNDTSRPIAIWLAVGVLAVLTFLTAVGGIVFNLSGADDAVEIAVGLVFVALAAVYLYGTIRLPSGDERARRLVLGAAIAHGTFNLVVKVGIEGETESLMFVALTAVVVALLATPPAVRFAAAR